MPGKYCEYFPVFLCDAFAFGDALEQPKASFRYHRPYSRGLTYFSYFFHHGVV
jgi:hypothetical protein